jgi:hypothetical protein
MAGATAQSVELYLKSYVETYMAACKAARPEVVPPFAKAYPYHVVAHILPNGAAVCLFTPDSASARIEVVQSKFEQARAAIQKKAHVVMLPFPPAKDFTKEDAAADAAVDVARDARVTTYKTGLEAAQTGLSDIGGQIKDIAKTNPWLERQLLAVADKLGGTAEPLGTLIAELGRMQGEERFSEDELGLSELQKYPSGDPPVAEITEQVVEKYLQAYIEAYRGTIKPDYPDNAKPAFYKGFPYHARAFILPNAATAISFKYAAPALKIDVSRATADLVADLLKGKEHSNFMGFPPMKSYRKEEAVYDAKLAVKRDMKIAYLRALMAAVRSQTGEEETNILEISKTNPWLEKQLQQLASRLSGVKQLLSALDDELQKSEEGKQYADHQQLLEALARYRATGKAAPAEAEILPMEPIEEPQASPPAWNMPGTPTKPPTSGWETAPIYASEEPAPQPARQRAAQAERAEPAPVRYELAPDEKQTLDMIKATLYNIDVKLDDFERRLNYMDKYVEGVQKQQLEKFSAQNEIVKSEAARARWAGIGIATTALVIVLMMVVDRWFGIFDPVRRMLFGG